ncbi:hypothetical protein D3C87_13760 [compost metagenome]
MKSKSVQYSIQNPCHENWNEMQPEVQGRFCSSCEKSVVDFTTMSDFSIVNYLENHKRDKVCGRFTKPQLNRDYQLNQAVSSPMFDLRAVVLGLALTTFSAVHSFSQTEPQEPVKIDTTVQQIPPIIMGKVAMETFDHRGEKIAKGTITNSLSSFKGIHVQLKNQDGKVLKTVQADSKGNFEFELNWKQNPTYVEVSGTGFETATRYFPTMNTLSDIRIELAEVEIMMLGEVIQVE